MDANEIMDAIDMIVIDDEEKMALFSKIEQERRSLFFKALGIEDDGRPFPLMTEAEFLAFDKPCKELKANEISGKTSVIVYFKFEPYHDVNFVYCFDDDTVYESRFYIGD